MSSIIQTKAIIWKIKGYYFKKIFFSTLFVIALCYATTRWSDFLV